MGQPVRIHRRALGILCALAEAKGEIVNRDELMALAMAWSHRSPGQAWARPRSDGNYGTLVPLSAWAFNRAFVSMSYLPIAMF